MDEESNSSAAADESRMDEDPSPHSGSDLEGSTSQMRSLNLRSRSDFDSPPNPEGQQSETNATPTSSSGSSYVPKTQRAPTPSQVESDRTGSLPSSWIAVEGGVTYSPMPNAPAYNSSSPTSSVAASERSRNTDMQSSPKATESMRSGASSSFRTPQPGRATRRSRRSTAKPSDSPSSLVNSSPASSSDKRRSSSLQRSSTSNLSSEEIEGMIKEIDWYFAKREANIYYLIFNLKYPINLVLDGWVKTETDSDDALIMLIQFIISCCGCKGEDFTKEEARKIQGDDRSIDPRKIANWMGEKWRRNPNLQHEVFQTKKKRDEFLETINKFLRMLPQKCSLEFCCDYLKDPILELLIEISDYKTKEKDTYMNFYIPSMSMAICIGTGLLIRGLPRVQLRNLFHQILNSVFRPRIWRNVKELDLVFAEEYAKWIFKMPSILDEDLRTEGGIQKTLFYHKDDEVRKITLKGLLKVFETHDTSKTKDFVSVAFMVAGDSLNIEGVSSTAINIMRICKQHPDILMIDALNEIEKFVYWKIYSLDRDEAKAVGHYLNDVIMENDPNTKTVLKELIDFYNELLACGRGSMARLTKVMIDINEALVDWKTMVDILQTDFSEPDFELMVNLIVNCLEHVATYEPINQDKVVMRERQIRQVTKHFGPVITELIERCLDPLNTKVLSNLVNVPRFLLIDRLDQKGLAEPLFELLCNLLEQDLSDVLLNQISKTLQSFNCVDSFANLLTELCEKIWTSFFEYTGLIRTEIRKNSAFSIDSLDKLYTILKQLYALICHYNFTNIKGFEFDELNKAAVFFEDNFEQQQHYAGLMLKYLGRIMATALFWRSAEDPALSDDFSVLSENEVAEREKEVNMEVVQFVQIAKQILKDPNEFHEWTLKREIFKLSCDVAKRQIEFINDRDFSRLLSEFVDSYLFVDAFVTDANSDDDIKYMQTISLAMFRAYCQLVIYNSKLYRPETLLKHCKDKEKYDGTFQQKYFEIMEQVVDELKKLNRNALISDMYICLLRQFKNDVESETPNSLKKLKATADHFLHSIKFRAGDENHLEMLHEKLMENALEDEENLTMFATLFTFLIHLSDSAKNRLLTRLEALLDVEDRVEIKFSLWVTNYRTFLEKKTGSKPSKKKKNPGKRYPPLDVTVEHSTP